MSSATSPARGLRKPPAAELYHSDGYSWAIEQADALRRRDFAAVDWDNVIEEIKDVGKAEVRSWTSYCARTIEHLLKIEHYRKATDEELKHWSQEVSHFRIRMARIIRKNPGLQGEYESMFADALGRRTRSHLPQTGRLRPVRRFLNGQGHGLSPPESNAAPRLPLQARRRDSLPVQARLGPPPRRVAARGRTYSEHPSPYQLSCALRTNLGTEIRSTVPHVERRGAAEQAALPRLIVCS